jgi:hypothetical protein
MISNKKSLFCFIIIFLNLINQINAVELKIINIKEINQKTEYFKNIFSPKQNVKKAIYLTSGVGLTIVISYLGYNYWKIYKNNSEKIKNKENTKPNESIEQPENNYLNKKDNLGLHAFKKGYKNGIKSSITTLVIFIGTSSLTFLADKFLDLFNLKEREHFLKITKNTDASLEGLQTIFSIKSETCFKEEVIDHFNYFTENLENLLAITNALSFKKLNQVNNYQIIKNAQELIVKKYLIFLEILKNVLEKDWILNPVQDDNSKKDTEFFSEADAQNIWPHFKELNNQTYRFIKTCNSILYEK